MIPQSPRRVANTEPTHDAAGNLTYDGVHAFSYDAWNRLVKVTKAYRDPSSGNVTLGSVVNEIEHDGLGRRIVKQVKNSANLDCTYKYYHDGQRVIEERNGSDQVIKQHVWGALYIDELLQTGLNDDPTEWVMATFEIRCPYDAIQLGSYWTAPGRMNDPLDAMILKVLCSAPPRWSDMNCADLTATEEEALALLTAAGLIERRFSARVSMVGDPVRLEITGTATGEYGFVEALEPVLAKAWDLWADHYNQRRAVPDQPTTNFFCEMTGTQSWRLTDQGELAQADIEAGNAQVVVDFVLKRTPVFAGQSVRGHGRAERIEESRLEQEPAKVEVTNLSELTGPIAGLTTMLERLFEAKAAEVATQPSNTAGTIEQPKHGTRGPARMRHDEAWRYLSTVQAWAEAQAQNEGRPQSKRVTKKAFVRGQGISIKDLNAMLAWYRKYQKQGLFPEDPRTLSRDKLSELFP